MFLDLWLPLLSIVLLVILSGVFSGSETAFTAASRPHIHQLAKNGNRRALMVKRLHDRKEELISALLFSNNAVNILASVLLTTTVLHFFDHQAIFYTTILLTFVIFIFSELLPKMYTFTHANRTALLLAPFLHLLLVILSPITNTVQKYAKAILKKCGVPLENSFVQSSETELRGIIDLHRGQEKEIREERAMLQSILDLDTVEVKHVMTPRSDCVTIDASLPSKEIIDLVLNSRYTRLPLWKDDTENIVGVLHAKSVLRALRQHNENNNQINILDISSTPWYIPNTTTLFDQLQAFRNKKEHFAFVVDEYGSILGIVTLEDILEEIVGDIEDEQDISMTDVLAEPGGTYVVNGRETIRDLNREFEWQLPQEKASTIAGLITHEARRIPGVGEELHFYDFKFQILSRRRYQITSLRIIPPTSTETNPDVPSSDS